MASYPESEEAGLDPLASSTTEATGLYIVARYLYTCLLGPGLGPYFLYCRTGVPFEPS